GAFDERNKQERDGQEAQGEEEERRKLQDPHLDGHELIAPEQGDGHRADDLDGRHGVLSFKTVRSRYRRARGAGIHGIVYLRKRPRRASAAACDVIGVVPVLPTTRSPSTKQTRIRAALEGSTPSANLPAAFARERASVTLASMALKKLPTRRSTSAS